MRTSVGELALDDTQQLVEIRLERAHAVFDELVRDRVQIDVMVREGRQDRLGGVPAGRLTRGGRGPPPLKPLRLRLRWSPLGPQFVADFGEQLVRVQVKTSTCRRNGRWH